MVNLLVTLSSLTVSITANPLNDIATQESDLTWHCCGRILHAFLLVDYIETALYELL